MATFTVRGSLFAASAWATKSTLKTKQASLESAGAREPRLSLDKRQNAVDVEFELDAESLERATERGREIMKAAAESFAWGVSSVAESQTSA